MAETWAPLRLAVRLQQVEVADRSLLAMPVPTACCFGKVLWWQAPWVSQILRPERVIHPELVMYEAVAEAADRSHPAKLVPADYYFEPAGRPKTGCSREL